MNAPIIVCVFGISGVGKTMLIRQALSGRNYVVHFTASNLIKQAHADPQITSEILRCASGDSIRANQQLLTTMFVRQVAATSAKLIVFDGHLLIDTDEQIVEIPLDVIAKLHPSILIHVEAEPSVIAERRRVDAVRVRPFRSTEALAEHQERSRELCCTYAAALGVKAEFSQSGIGDNQLMPIIDELLMTLR